ncbi:nickel ABC transporter permease [Halorubrum ezzemoulense]|uniref:Glutathione ABC transporter permease GsiC n=1 Tax=Halorubrum ezzemoulense TaxID=337243 RepID=A0A256JNL9_HALEZ|nr:nickel ABC transporter permease [Halorubrum ezzemoulense]OYR69972.1 glutathione ABC transporter permease GsiC [Halorubrum ezzemoulense]
MHWQYLLRRLTLTAATLVLVSAVTYSLIGIAPGDPAELVLQKQLGQPPPTEQIETFRAKHGLDEPIHWQYLHWFGDLLQGDLGQSYYHERSVSELLLDRLPVTIKLAAGGLAVSLAVSLPTGILSARRPQGLADHLSQTIALLGVAMPNFWLGYLLIFAFSLKIGLTPVYGSGTLAHLALPSITLGTGLAAVQTRLLRATLQDTLDAEFVTAARTRGLRERLVVGKHALRNALLPLLTVLGLQLGFVLNGAVVVEVVFQRPGLGTLLVDAIFDRNYPVVQGVTLLAGFLFVSVNTVTDLAYGLVDPRIDVGSDPA